MFSFLWNIISVICHVFLLFGLAFNDTGWVAESIFEILPTFFILVTPLVVVYIIGWLLMRNKFKSLYKPLFVIIQIIPVIFWFSVYVDSLVPSSAYAQYNEKVAHEERLSEVREDSKKVLADFKPKEYSLFETLEKDNHIIELYLKKDYSDIVILQNLDNGLMANIYRQYDGSGIDDDNNYKTPIQLDLKEHPLIKTVHFDFSNTYNYFRAIDNSDKEHIYLISCSIYKEELKEINNKTNTTYIDGELKYLDSYMKEILTYKADNVADNYHYYGIPTHTVEISDFGVVQRNDLGMKGLGWLILYEGDQVLHRVADKELEYDLKTLPYFQMEGEYQVYLLIHINGEYRRISNIVTYSHDTDFSLTSQ